MKIPTFLLFAAVLSTAPLGVSQAIASPINKAKPSLAHNMPIITKAWARATVPGQPVGAAYMTIVSPVNTLLLEAQTDVARLVEVHDMHQHEGVMQMRAHGPLELPKGEPIELAPGGTHFMLLGLKKPLKAGETLQLKMTFGSSAKDKAKNTVTVNVPVRPIGQ